MKISEVLAKAQELLAQPGAFTRRAAARNGLLEAVHALDESATCWDCVGAIQKVLGEMAGTTFDEALLCLRAGALKVSPPRKGRADSGRGVVEITDEGTEDEIAAMFAFAIQTAINIEGQLTAAA